MLNDLQPFPPRVSSIQLVPELDIFLTLFPTQKNLLALHDAWEVQKASFQVLDLDFALVEFQQYLSQIRQEPQQFIDYGSAGIATRLHQFFDLFLGLLHFLPKVHKAFQPKPDMGQQCARILARVVLVELISHWPGAQYDRKGYFGQQKVS